jgi:hypothetical protein
MARTVTCEIRMSPLLRKGNSGVKLEGDHAWLFQAMQMCV